MSTLAAILTVYVAGAILTGLLLHLRNRQLLRRLPPQQRMRHLASPAKIKPTDLLIASAVWPLVLFVLCQDLVNGKFVNGR